MRTNRFFQCLFLSGALASTGQAVGQASVPGNSGGPTDYLGWDNLQGFPLQIRHDNNQQIQFFTNNIRRMQLLPSDTYTIGGFTGQSKSGSLLLARDVAAFYSGGAPGPFSRLHLADTPNGTQQSGYRSNMQNGVTMTGNNDQMYVGQLYHGLDYTDAAIVWSDNPGGWLADRLTFNFTSSYNSSATRGSNTFRGLQTLLVQPAESGDEAYVGVGDFDADGATPNERLHVHGGTIRVDSLIPDYRNDTLSRVVMSDGLGRMHWRHISTWPSTGTADCKWTLLGAGNASIATAYAGNPGCPQADRKVGIGTGSPQYKLSVFHSEASSTAPGGLSVDFVAEPIGWAHGIQSSVEPLNGSVEFAAGVQGRVIAVDSIGIAVYGIASALALDGFTRDVSGTAGVVFGPNNGSVLKQGMGARGEVHGQANGTINQAYGTKGWVLGAGAITYSYGAFGHAQSGTNRYSVFGANPGGGANDWSGYFPGKTLVGGTTFTPSDENLKTDIQPLTGATGRLMQFRPKSFRHRTSEFPQLGLSEGLRYGFIVQDVEQLFPQWTTTVHHPEQLDTLGNVVTPAVEFMAYTTDEIPALLVGGFQEHHQALVAQAEETAELRSLVQELRTELSELRQQVAGCCANPDRSLQQPAPAGGPAVQPMDDATGDDKLRIVPNPFSEPPTVHYTLERGGRAQLLVHGGDGRGLRVLHEATMEPGSYQLVWDTNALAPGMYYVTLLLDGQPVVEKAVKVAR